MSTSTSTSTSTRVGMRHETTHRCIDDGVGGGGAKDRAIDLAAGLGLRTGLVGRVDHCVCARSCASPCHDRVCGPGALEKGGCPRSMLLRTGQSKSDVFPAAYGSAVAKGKRRRERQPERKGTCRRVLSDARREHHSQRWRAHAVVHLKGSETASRGEEEWDGKETGHSRFDLRARRRGGRGEGRGRGEGEVAGECEFTRTLVSSLNKHVRASHVHAGSHP